MSSHYDNILDDIKFFFDELFEALRREIHVASSYLNPSDSKSNDEVKK